MTPMTPDDIKALWASHCRHEFDLLPGLLDPAGVPAFGVDTATRLRDLPLS
jgi:hypothetical protein